MFRALYSISQVLLLMWVVIAHFAWILRDGLGPGSTASSGVNAVSRFLLTFYWGPVAAALATATFLLWRRTVSR